MLWRRGSICSLVDSSFNLTPARKGFPLAAFFDGQEQKFSNLVQEFPALQNPVNEFLAGSPDDSQLEGRFKRTLEGLGLGALTEGLLLGVKAIRAARSAKAAAEEAGPEAVRQAAQEIDAARAGMKSLGDVNEPLVAVHDAEADAVTGAALRGPRSAETDALERSGFAVDRDVMESPVAMDNKRRYGIRRETLEAEGEFGERWTNIETKAEDWPQMPEGKTLRGALADTWRKIGKTIYDSIRGEHIVEGTGEKILVGSVGRRHIVGQGQSPEVLMALPQLPELIKKAFKTGEYNPKLTNKKTPDMRPATIYHSAAVIDGKPYDMTLVAKRNASGDQELVFYDMRAKNKGPGIPEVLNTSDDASLFTSAGLDDLNINQAGARVNAGNADLSTTKVSDFFGHVKDIVDDVKPGELTGSGGKTADEPGKMFINFSRIDAPEDVKTVMQNMADSYRADLESARRGARTFEQTALSAEQENAWKILAERRTGEPLNAEQSLAARNLWASSGQKLSELAELATQTPTDENLFAFRKMVEVHRAIQNEVIAARTETARALDSWRIPSGSRELNLRQMAEMLDGSGGVEAARELAARVSRLSQAGMAQELEAVVAKTPYQITRDSIQEAWVMGLLSNPKTHLVNMMGNATVALGQVFERGIAARIGRVLGDETGVQMGESLTMLNGMIGGVQDGLRLAAKAFRMNDAGGCVDGRRGDRVCG